MTIPNQITQSNSINYISFLKFIPVTIIIASTIVIFLTINSTGENGIISLMFGYSGLLAGIVFFLVITFVSLESIKFSYIIDLLPFILILTVIIITIVFTNNSWQRISDGHVAPEYYTYSYISLFLIIVQLWFLVSAIRNIGQNPLQIFSQPTYSLLCLLWTFNIIVVIIISILLKFYGTNG
jgi:hypothetical protein